MKVLIIAFGHSENVLTLSKNISNKLDITLLFVTSKDKFTNGILDLDLTKLPYGLTKSKDILDNIFPSQVNKYVGNKFKIWILRTPSRKIIKDVKLINYKLCKKTSKEILKEEFDVIHYNGISGFLMYFQLFLINIPKVWTLHDYMAHSGEENIKNSIIRKFYTKFKFIYIQHYKYLEEELIKTFNIMPSKVFQVYCGYLDIYNSYVKDNYFNNYGDYILFFGRISKYKGLKYLIEAFESQEIKNSKVKLIIAGKGEIDLEESLLKYDNIIFINEHIETDRLVNLINSCMFVVLPYTDATHSAVIMTAYALGKPVIASKVGGIPEVIEDGVTGYLVTPKNTESLSKAIFNLINNKKKIEEISHNIKNFKINNEISWSNIEDKMVNVYNYAKHNYR